MAVVKKKKSVTKTRKSAPEKPDSKVEAKQVETATERKGASDSKIAANPRSAATKRTPAKKTEPRKTDINKSGITKEYLDKKDACAVTFRLPKAAVSKAKTVCIVGDFNDWNIYAAPMKKGKDGAYSIKLELVKGKEYQFRYLIDDKRWENDWNADKYVKNPFGDSDNSVVVV